MRIHVILFLIVTGLSVRTASAQSSIFGGVSIPMGDFASTDSASGGYARTGITVGIETYTPFYYGSEVGIGIVLSYHTLDEQGFRTSHPSISSRTQLDLGDWLLIWPMAGAGFRGLLTANSEYYVHAMGGALFGMCPEMNAEFGGIRYTQAMTMQVAAAYGVAAGVTISGTYEIGMRYYGSRPEYRINVQGGGTSTEPRSLYVTNTLLVHAGILI